MVERGDGTLMAALEDVDSDGDPDLVVHFQTQVLVASGDLDPEAEELIVSGETGDGTPIRGVEAVKIVDRDGP